MADLNQSKYFSIHEFSDREIEVAFASQEIFSALDTYREKLAVPIYPSPVKGALSRFNGSETSRHFVKGRIQGTSFSDEELLDSTILEMLETNPKTISVDKFSTGIDIFVDNPEQNFWKAYIMAISCGLFGGIGVYAHTKYKGKPHPMLHLDIRPHVFPTIWARDADDNYIYPLRGTGQLLDFTNELAAAIKNALDSV